MDSGLRQLAQPRCALHIGDDGVSPVPAATAPIPDAEIVNPLLSEFQRTCRKW
jgi:hypothetical protein